MMAMRNVNASSQEGPLAAFCVAILSSNRSHELEGLKGEDG
jgi:hypothetical protein